MSDPSDSPAAALLANERRRLIGNVIDSLDPVDAELLRSRFRNDESLATIAARGGISKPAVHGRLTRLARRLRKKLAAVGVNKFHDLF